MASARRPDRGLRSVCGESLFSRVHRVRCEVTGRHEAWSPRDFSVSGGRRTTVSAKRLRTAAVAAGMVVSIAAAGSDSIVAIRTTNQNRQHYLAHAMIWHTPPDLSPADLRKGLPDSFAETLRQGVSDEDVPCTFTQAGATLGGASPKFLCRTSDGRSLRVKYWDSESQSGNREVFAAIAASRLMWALGFNAIPAISIDLRCEDCPENPETGNGRRQSKRYAAMLQAFWPTPSILTGDNLHQGWSWQELDRAIQSLPHGPERTRQRTHFDALALFGVFMQHGDRKPEQQRLYCAEPFDAAAGAIRTVANRGPMLFERPGAAACPSSAVTILDAGLTFGGAGRTSHGKTATMNLTEWQDKPVFRTNDGAECHGYLIDSLKARGGEPNPLISEEGRRFLLDQFHRLTTDHVRAIFTAAHVDQLESSDRSGAAATVDAWVAAFENKVRQIDAQRCQAME